MTIVRIDLDNPEEYDIHRVMRIVEFFNGEIIRMDASSSKGIHIVADIDYALVCARIDDLERLLPEFKSEIEHAKKVAKEHGIDDPLDVLRIAMGDDVKRVITDVRKSEGLLKFPQQVLFTHSHRIIIEESGDDGRGEEATGEEA